MRSGAQGLARVEIETSDTYVAFAAKAGSLAADGEGKNSPFTKALLAHLATPGLDVRLALGKVRDQVVRETNRRQEPYVYGSLGGDIVALVPSPGQVTGANPNPARPAAKTEPRDPGALRSLHGNWQIRCDTPPGAQAEQCAVLQSVTTEDRPNVGLTVIMLKTAAKTGVDAKAADRKAADKKTSDKKLNNSAGGKQYLLRVLAPLGLLMPSGLGLKIDGADIGRAGFVRCLPNGCVAEVVVDDALMRQLRTGKTATFVIFQTPEEGIGIPISLAGLADGLDALP